MTRTRHLTTLLALMLMISAACNAGAPEKDVVLEDQSGADAADDVALDVPGELPHQDLPAEVAPEVADASTDLPLDTLEEITGDLAGDAEPDGVVQPCAGHVECDDGDPCTGDFCQDGICSHQMKNCSDANACT
jgi:hypothetical protein